MHILKKRIIKHSQEEKLFHTKEDLRWATPEIVADYRAERLKCNIIADLGCGIGFQTISFAKKCKRVYAVEKDEQKINYAKKNAEILGLNNITFIHGDILDKKTIEQIKDSEIIFCDPERLASEDERKTDTIRPDIKQLIDSYSKITDKIAIEFPPQIQKIEFDCEKEYVSTQGKLNRLTLYFGSLKKGKVSAVVLPEKAILIGQGNGKVKKNANLLKYMYEVDGAVSKAGLIPELAKQTGAEFYFQNKSAFLTSASIIKSPFFRNSFQILGICIFEKEKIIECLQKNNAGQAVIRFEIDPQDYWKERKDYEKDLKGKEKISIFKFDDKAVIAKIVK
jgi:SAM-dependent methyltransferase